MSTPIQFNGSDPEFTRRTQAFAAMIPDIQSNLADLGIEEAIQGLSSFKFVEMSPSAERSQYVTEGDDIMIYPMNFKAGDRPDWSIYWALGARHWALNISPENKVRWSNLTVEPSKATVARILKMLDGKHTFRQVIESVGEAVGRLVALHITNALVKNGIRPTGLAAIDLNNYPPVSDFMHGLRSFSLRPLVSAYGSICCLQGYAGAFAEYAVNNGKFPIREHSTAKAFTALFSEVTIEN